MSLTNRPKGDDHCRMWKDASKWRLSDQGAEYDQFQKVDALQSCDLFAAEKAAHSAVFNQFCELIIREVE